MTKLYYFRVTGSRSKVSHESRRTYYKVESNSLVSAWRKVRKTNPFGKIYALQDDAEKRYPQHEFVSLKDDSQAPA